MAQNKKKAKCANLNFSFNVGFLYSTNNKENCIAVEYRYHK
jgi:hypothetical protein